MTAPSLAVSIRRRLRMGMLLPGLGLAAFIAVFLLVEQKGGLERQQRSVAAGLGRYVEMYVESGVSGLLHLAESPYLGDPYRQQMELEAFFNAFPQFESVLLMDKQDRVYATMPADREVDLSLQMLGAVSPGSGSRSMVSPPMVSADTGNVVIYLVVRRPHDGSVVGVLNLAALGEFIAGYEESDIGQVILMDRYGNLIAHPESERVLRQDNMGNLEIVRQGREGLPEARYFQDQDRWYLGTMAKIPNMDWMLLLAKPVRDVFMPVVKSLVVLVALVVAIYAMVVLTMERMMQKRVSEPLSGFAADMEQVGQGDYSAARAGRRPFREMELIGEAFRTMARRIRSREQDLVHAEEKYRALFENSLQAIVRTTINGVIKDANPAMARMFGYASPQELMVEVTDSRLQLWADPRDRDRITGTLARGEEVRDMEVRFKRRDGAIWWGSVFAWPYLDDQGRLVMIEAMIQDVTSRREAEKDLHRSRVLLMESQRLSHTGGWEIDPVSGGVNWTDEECRIHGLEPGTDIPDFTNLVSNLVHPEDRDMVVAAWEGYVARGASPSRGLEYRIIRPDGEVRVLRGVAVPEVDSEGRVIRIFGASRDVTEEKVAESALIKARDEAREAARVKSEFLANMSHELRTPLAGIFGMLRLALDSDLAPDQRAWLQMALKTGSGLMSVINDVLDFTKMEAGSLRLVQEPFQVREVVAQVMENFGIQARDKGLEMRFSVDQDLPAVLVGDQARLRQILFNLVGNGVKFCPQGSVSVHVSSQPHSRYGRCRTLFEIKDTGIGFAPEALESLFTPFTQADGAFNRRYSGTGLGLTIVQRLVQLMGGSLAVDSEPGEGTTVYLSLDFGLPTATEQDAIWEDHAPEPVQRPMRILLAEDEPVNRIAVRRFLENLGHEVVLAEDGAMALDILSREEFHCVIMDVQMPEMDGITAVRKLRAGEVEGADPAVPVVALTAHALGDYRETMLAAGMDDCLAKPVELEDLAAILSRVDRRRG